PDSGGKRRLENAKGRFPSGETALIFSRYFSRRSESPADRSESIRFRSPLRAEAPSVGRLVGLPSGRVLSFLQLPGCHGSSPGLRPLHGGGAAIEILSPFPRGPVDDTIGILMHLFQHLFVDLLAFSRRLIRTIAYRLLLRGSLGVELTRAIAFIFLL